MNPISILEVGPRDGLQNEKIFLSLEDKTELIKKLASLGLKRIELGSFVSPQVIPQMQDTEYVAKSVLKLQSQQKLSSEIQFSALVPNQKGLKKAIDCGLKEVAIFLSCTDSFSKKNINCTVKESLKNYKIVSQEAIDQGLKVRAYLSVSFACPYEGLVNPNTVLELAKALQDLSVYEMAISDTLGIATPQQVQSLIQVLSKQIPIHKLAFHFHNVHGLALANVWAAYQMGILSFDGSVGGLGGCPYAQVESGNVATESLFYLFHGATSPYVNKLVETAKWLETKLQKKLPSPLLRIN